MKTFEYKINPDTATEYAFVFDAANRPAADIYVKEHTRRGSKFEFVSEANKTSLQDRPNADSSKKISQANYRFVFDCFRCPNVWYTESAFSHIMMEECPKCGTGEIEDLQTYNRKISLA